METSFEQRVEIQQLTRGELARKQIRKLNSLFETILPKNRLYQEKLGSSNFQLQSLDELAKLPVTTKGELIGDSASNRGFATNLTYPIENYVRLHRTSGTKGKPLIVLDTAEDWEWWMEAWQFVLDSAELAESDRVVMAFSFGPFIGFWSAYDASHRRGALVAPAGGMNTHARIDLIRAIDATVIFCTPSYAIHMAEMANERNISLASSSVSRIVVAGEPGGNIPAIREKIETEWRTKVIDHAGASEIGPWGFADSQNKGLLVNEWDFLAEFRSVETGKPAEEGELSELILTTLGRTGSPVIRYQTGDLVRPKWSTDNESNFVLLEGGVLGRVDDMMIVRGVNIFPSSIEQVLRSFPEIVEYRMTAFKQGAMDNLRIEIEDQKNDSQRVAEELQLRLGLRVDVECVEPDSLPRFELKGKRFIDERAT